MATLTDLAGAYPELVHVTYAGAFSHSQRLGLRSVVQLVADAGLDADDAAALTTKYRTTPHPLTLPDGTAVMLRDQLRRRKDVECSLDDISETQWLYLLNDRVYLFPSRHKRVSELVDAYAAKGQPQGVIRFDTFRLLRGHEHAVEVATVNSGTFPRVKGPTRGRGTFIPLSMLPGGYVSKVQEVTVKGWLPVSADSVRSVVLHQAGAAPLRVWP